MTKMEADVRVGGRYSVHHLQPPLGLPRRGDAGYSALQMLLSLAGKLLTFNYLYYLSLPYGGG